MDHTAKTDEALIELVAQHYLRIIVCAKEYISTATKLAHVYHGVVTGVVDQRMITAAKTDF